MKLIYINTFREYYHLCEVLSYKYNPITKKYILYYFDRSMNNFYYAHLVESNGTLLIQDLKFKSEEWLPSALFNFTLDNLDVSRLPPYIASIERSKLYGDEKVSSVTPYRENVFKSSINYLEIESYEDALNSPKYHYFVIDDMHPTFEGFNYLAKYECSSPIPLKKNIIARHKIDISLSDVEKRYDDYYFQFGLGDQLSIDLESEELLVNKLIKLSKEKRENVDTILLTKLARMILKEENSCEAIREYQEYISTYYDKWVLENKEKHL